jgi:integrase
LGAIAVQKISVITINKQINAYADLFKWAKANGYTAQELFAGTTIRQHKERTATQRTAFNREQITAIRAALADLRPRLTKKPYRYWGTLIGLYTGARLNEVCQLQLTDIKRNDDIWYFDINDEGERKSVKNTASRRRVPVHKVLLELGILDYVAELRQRGEKRLFPELSYCPKNGWGRSLGRWFNEEFLPSLEVKTKELVFHSFRHSMITELKHRNVQPGIVQAIVGHTPDSVTEGTYMKGRYKLEQLCDAIDLLP